MACKLRKAGGLAKVYIAKKSEKRELSKTHQENETSCSTGNIGITDELAEAFADCFINEWLAYGYNSIFKNLAGNLLVWI